MNWRKTGGRKAGTPNRATAEIRQVAMLHGPTAIKRLAVLMKGSGPVAVAACRELLDRGYGKSPQPHDGDGQGRAVIVNVLTGVPR
jgi:hypothetical protein